MAKFNSGIQGKCSTRLDSKQHPNDATCGGKSTKGTGYGERFHDSKS